MLKGHPFNLDVEERCFSVGVGISFLFRGAVYIVLFSSIYNCYDMIKDLLIILYSPWQRQSFFPVNILMIFFKNHIRSSLMDAP